MVSDIEMADLQTSEWIAEVCPSVPVLLSPPGPSQDIQRGVVLHLFEIREEPEARTSVNSGFCAVLRYLVMACGPEPIQCHRDIWALLLNASKPVATQEKFVDAQPLTAEMWSAMGIAPCPSFILNVRVRHTFDRPQVPRVSKSQVSVVPIGAIN